MGDSGCVSINRNIIRDLLEASLQAVPKKHCLQPNVYAKHHDGNLLKLYVEVHFGNEQPPDVQRKDLRDRQC